MTFAFGVGCGPYMDNLLPKKGEKMLTQSEETKLTNLAAYDEYEKTQPVSAVCESCGHKITSYEPLPDSMPCPNCEMEIDLK